jgi:phenylalanyl-tRNA synthetase beta chain
MKAPISWLKDFVDIKLPLKELLWRLTEAGLTCESYEKKGEEIVLDIEVTANRPDWMSIIGIAREIAAIQGTKLKEPATKNLPKQKANFPIDLTPDYELFDRWTGVVIKDINIKPSPKWLADRLVLIGLRPINNIIDITNYVMFELGIPMHTFDYDEILGQIMTVQRSKGGEEFTSVDELSYKLPKDAIIIKDAERLIDLAGIKGGLNSGIKKSTKNIFLHITIDNPVLIRRTSLALGLRSDASIIYERGPDKGGTINCLKRAANLIIELAGGEIASEIIDLKKQEFRSWNLEVGTEKMNKVLGIEVPISEAIKILERLNLSPKKTKTGIMCQIPTYRADLKIEEDLIEEVARIYGYNKFPQTLPQGCVAGYKIPYYFDDTFMLKLKDLLVASGYFEVMTFSLVSGPLIKNFGLKTNDFIKITNPVSSEYEYMRKTLILSLLTGIKTNTNEVVRLFEIDKVFLGTPESPQEVYKVAAVATGVSFREFKGVIDLILQRLNIESYKIEFEVDKPYFHPSKSATIKVGEKAVGEFGEINPSVSDALEIKRSVFCFEFDVKTLESSSKERLYKIVPENPPQIEDITLTFPAKTRIGEVANLISSIDHRVSQVELKDIYKKDSYTFRVWYQNPTKTLTNKEVEEIRHKILSSIKTKFGGIVKDR